MDRCKCSHKSGSPHMNRVLTTPEHPCIQIVSLIVLYSEGSWLPVQYRALLQKAKAEGAPTRVGFSPSG
jgi:hypothetical protein